ncbi:hypothetical protein M8J76_000298 [Diaphorina citri]|nr:hypothetical protein M8J75_013145 [Diaphorina citri]KAI5721884.1 hypothetical protein M8J76_000298 [Diaphorina citri]
MPRKYTRKSAKGLYDPGEMKKACELVLQGRSIRDVCKQYNVTRETLRRKVNAIKAKKEVTFTPKYNHRQVFNQDQEDKTVHYLKLSCAMFYGLTSTDCRKLAYQTARINEMSYPSSWDKDGQAGEEWLRCFLLRNRLSLRSPEGCSLARASAFNRVNVKAFFDNYKKLIDKHPSLCDPSRIFNLDETKTLTVVDSGKVIAPTGIRAVSAIQSQERGTLVTTCCIIRADGNSLPPVMIFPCVNYKIYMIRGAPANTLGLANATGWMNSELFVETLRHFIKYSYSTPDNPSLLIYDNHESHINIQVYELAKASGVHILTLPPHSTHKMQPLDVGVYSPFQKYYTSAMKSWMMRNPAKNVSIYEVASFVGEAFPKALTPVTIMSAFRTTGIYPMDEDIFQDSDYMPSLVTERPLPEESPTLIVENPSNEPLTRNDGDLLPSATSLSNDTSNEPLTRNDGMRHPQEFPLGQDGLGSVGPIEHTTKDDEIRYPKEISDIENTIPELPKTPLTDKKSLLSTEPSTSGYADCKKKFISPEEHRGLPKINLASATKKRRRSGKSMILTDTPEKAELVLKDERKNKKNSRRSICTKKKQKEVQQAASSDSEEELTGVIYMEESDGSEDFSDLVNPDAGLLLEDNEKAALGKYVIVEFTAGKEHKVQYVGRIIGIIIPGQEYEVMFTRSVRKGEDKFKYPLEPDISYVKKDDIIYVLPDPLQSDRKTERQKQYITFPIKIGSICKNLK